MKTKKLCLLISLLFLLANCSKGQQKTSAKLNLKLSGIMNLNSGIGSGGALLFGKSSSGEQFGKIISAAEVNLDLLNGEWSFYTVMWEKGGGSNFSDVAYCGKSANKLAGGAVNINLDLSNANCTDSIFSGGKHFSKELPGSGLKNTFAKLFVEDCDDLSKSASATCNLDNQGNALSYRLNFKSYNKAANGSFVFGNEMIKSQCMSYSNVNAAGMNVNFPTSNSAMPFIVSMEMYLGSPDCALTIPETKGMYTHVFDQGLEIQKPDTKMIFSGSSSCSPKNSNNPGVCADLLGTMSANNCSIPETISKFTKSEDCMSTPVAPTATTSKNIKHIFSIPKSMFCYADISNYGASNSDLFPAGNGTKIRPFKICNEWQINQIGELGSSALMSTYHYKLLNDLDMNKTDFGAFPKPSCTRELNSIVSEHHNFNPLDGLFDNNCSTLKSAPSFTGGFNGNNKTISHARIQADGSMGVGFIRKLQSGTIKNLNFIDLEIYGGSKVGAIAGSIDANNDVFISNITIDGLDLEGKATGPDQNSNGSLVGSVAGLINKNVNNVSINRFLVTGAELHGTLVLGGLIGENGGASINESKYSGSLRADFGSGSVGGLVGFNRGGLITKSLSEGLISSIASNIGGVVGINTENGKVTDSYSTMYISGSSASLVGGIIGDNVVGGFNNIFFDGVIAEYDTGGFTKKDYISNGAPSSITTANCQFTGSPIGLSPSNIQFCSKVSRSPTLTGVTQPVIPTNGLWHLTQGELAPRLKWESEITSRICLITENSASVVDQKNILKRGLSANNPIIICNPSQFSQLSNLGVNDFAILGENLNLSELTFLQLVPNFSGNLDGKNFGIYGLVLDTMYADNQGLALIKNNSGTISNLNIVGNKLSLSNSNPDIKTGVLTAKNSGVIRNVRFALNTVSGSNIVGIVSGENSGLIDKIKIDFNQISGSTLVGGVAGFNTLNSSSVGGIIRRVSVNASIFKKLGVFTEIGGIAGKNMGTIDQALFEGRISTDLFGNEYDVINIGGISGLNEGVVSNSMTSNQSDISTISPHFIAGLVGRNEGHVKKSIALGKVRSLSITEPMTYSFSAAVNNFDNGTSENISFLENNLAFKHDSYSIIAACEETVPGMGSGIATFTNTLFQNQYSPNFYINFSSNYGYNNSSLNSYSAVLATGPTTMNYSGQCYIGQTYEFLRGFGPIGKPSAYFANAANFPALSLAYPGYLEDNVLEYHKALMYKREPAMDLPVWVIEEGDSYPKLLQLEH